MRTKKLRVGATSEYSNDRRREARRDHAPGALREGMRPAAFVGLLVMLGGCPRTRGEPPASIDAAPATSAAEADAPAAPRVTGDWLQTIDLGGQGFAYVAPPVGSRDRRPIVVAVHGAGDDPGFMCSAWRSITDGYPFVVCPAATRVASGRYTWSSSGQIEQRVLQAIAATEQRWPENVAVGAPVVYVAFSQGATLAGPVLTRHGDRITRVVLTEGGYGVFDDRAARAFAKAGGQRVVFSCSSGGCDGGFRAAVAALGRASVQAQIEDSGPLGHSIPPPAREGLNRQLPFLVEGLRGWEGYAHHPRQTAH